jgi:hypothetical protein
MDDGYTEVCRMLSRAKLTADQITLLTWDVEVGDTTVDYYKMIQEKNPGTLIAKNARLIVEHIEKKRPDFGRWGRKPEYQRFGKPFYYTHYIKDSYHKPHRL